MYKVLLIDDEPLVLASLERRMDWGRCGFTVAGKAQSGAEGLQLIESLRPDLVFTDIRMPGMSGLELIRDASRAHPDMLFAVLSGYGEFEYARQAITYGVLGFCMKPLDEEELYALLEKAAALLAKRRAFQPFQLPPCVGREDTPARKRAFFEEQNLLDGRPKWMLELHGPAAAIPEGLSAWMLPSDRIRTVLLLAGGEELLFLPAGEATAGLSAPFYGPEEFDRAYLEARIASYSFFLDGERCHRFSGVLESERTGPLLRKLREGFAGRDYAVLRQVMAQFRQGFSERSLTIKDAFRLNNAAMLLLPGRQDGVCDYYDDLTARYDGASAMVDQLERELGEALADLSENDTRSGAVRDILVYLSEHYSDPNLSISKLSQVFGFNANYISQIFKRSESETITACLTRIRMEHACALLKSSDGQVRQVGEQVGYDDYFYFAKVFKKHTGFTPSEYRARFREGLEKRLRTPEEESADPKSL